MKRNVLEFITRFVSTLLVTAMLLALMPAISFANETDQNSKIIISEDTSLRSEFSKHFLMSDGSYMAIAYPEAVHEKIDGEWQEIDNTLSIAAGTYTSASESFPVSFSSANNEQMVSIESKGKQLAWSLKAIADDMIISGSKNAEIAVSDRASFSMENAEKAVSAIEYSEAFGRIQNISVNYTVMHNKLEEDIIIKEPGSVDSFRMVMDAADMTAVVNKDNSISFFDGDTKVFNISPPYMCDAADNVLNDFTVEITQQDGKLWIDYIPAYGWLDSQDRVYPILFDPAITTTEYQSGIIDTYVAEGDTAVHSSEQKIYAGIKSGKIHRSYIKITALPTIPESMPITGVELVLRNTNGSSTGRTFGVYKVTSAWNPSTITYANQPGIGAMLATDAFDANDLVNTFSLTSEINSFYPEHFSGTNFGYMVRYVDESKTNPDYNAFYSTEHGTKSSRPYIRIYYSYFKPTCLSNNAVYTLQNAGSSKYLSVYGGTDANGTNVCQLTKDNTTKQQFRIQTTDSGACVIRANCSSNGTNRVLDIVKSNGYVVSGCNVQIYTNVDAIAQEWVIIPVGLGFRISPRTNMSLALATYGTANGTASGTTSTSAGNVYLTQYTGNPEQHWFIYDADGNRVSSEDQEFENDDYYLNNIGSGKFLKRNVSNAYAASGTVSSMGSVSKWKITRTQGDNYVIRNIDDATKYLAATPGTMNPDVSIQTVTGTVPNSCLWAIYYANNGVVICNVGTGWYLCESLGDIIAMPYSSAASMNMYWRCVPVSDYGSSSSNSMRELTSAFTIDALSLDVGQTKQPVINKTPIGTNVVWAEPSDFTFEASPSGIVSINNETGSITGLNSGTATITATHKVTGRSKVFNAYIVPDFFDYLLERGDITPSDIQYTDDGFYICTKSIADILNKNGVYNTVSMQPYVGGIQGFFDDWYVYCVDVDDSSVYGLYKMREEENDHDYEAEHTFDGDAAGVSVSFISFDTTSMTNYLDAPSTQSQALLENTIRICCEPSRGGVHNTQLREYFIDAQNDGSYLIAENYIDFIAKLHSTTNSIEATSEYNKILEAIDDINDIIFDVESEDIQVALQARLDSLIRVPNALVEINENAGYDVFENNRIVFNNVTNLTYYEQCAILAMHTGCVNYFSFAAEVKVHALFLDLTNLPEGTFLGDAFESYEHALIADVALGEETDSGGIDSLYYDLDGYFVNEQEACHGDEYGG
ncbi:MAG: RICIN domain-containing protein [Clostridia bacterium]|nr:RICIN domain-containing protein [Clostridia bacterium]